jgi:hypothetical protein
MHNIGTADRIARLIVGTILVALPFLINPVAWLFWALIVIGGVLVVTAAAGFCPVYALLGLRTDRRIT